MSWKRRNAETGDSVAPADENATMDNKEAIMDCGNCKYYEKEHEGYPCCDCKNTAVPGTEKYKLRPLLWEPNYGIEHEAENDAVFHPSHYTQGDIECIDAMKSAFGADELAVYCKIAAFKYIWRCERKNGSEDIKKAIWYLKKYLELKESESHNAV